MQNANDVLANIIIGAATEVHQILGPGLQESAYEACLAYELNLRKLKVNQQQPLPITCNGVQIPCDCRIDLLVEDEVIVEIKSVKSIAPVHEAQLMSYLKLHGGGWGLLINFNVPSLKEGIRRLQI